MTAAFRKPLEFRGDINKEARQCKHQKEGAGVLAKEMQARLAAMEQRAAQALGPNAVYTKIDIKMGEYQGEPSSWTGPGGRNEIL